MTPPLTETGSHHARGIAILLVAVGFYVGMTTSVKYLTADYSVFQIVFFRSVISLPVVFVVLLTRDGIAGLATRRPGLQFVRNASWVVGNICLFLALSELALAEASAIQFTSPLMVTAMSALALKAHVGIRRWAAVVAGFVGVLVMVPPTGEVKIASLVVLLATCCYASTVVMTRVLSASDSVGVIFFYLTLTGTLTGALALPWVWVTPDTKDLVVFLLVGLCGAIAQLGLIMALRLTPPHVLAPFDYTVMLWALGFDLVLWSTVPTTQTLVGAIIVAGAGLYVARREATLTKRREGG